MGDPIEEVACRSRCQAPEKNAQEHALVNIETGGYTCERPAEVAELADAPDSKSGESNLMRVRVPPSVLLASKGLRAKALSPFFVDSPNHQWQISGSLACALDLCRWSRHIAAAVNMLLCRTSDCAQELLLDELR